MSRGYAWSLAGVAVIAALAGGYWLGAREAGHGGHSTVPAPQPAAGPAGRKVLYYRNPMGLADTSPVPKKDSMGMDYVPVYADEADDDAGEVRISPARVQTLGVKTATAERRKLDLSVRAVGRVEVDERGIADIAPKFEGWIERLHVNATGDPVRKGQPLFSVYSPELVSALKELRIAESLRLDAPEADPAARDSAQRLAQAARERLRNWDIAGEDAGIPDARLTFRSPIDGIVLEKSAVEGMRFAPGTSIYRIANLSRVWVIADVYEKDLERVAVDQPAGITIDAFPGKRFSARVAYIYPTLNTATRTTPVRLQMDNRDGSLRPGMFAHVEIGIDNSRLRLAVPNSAVLDSGEEQWVLLAGEPGRYRPQSVRLGLRGREYVEVLEGVGEGDRVVTSANFLIDAESNLKSALAKFSAPEQPQPARTTYRSTGSFEDLDKDTGAVLLSHEAIPELQWPAMTMEFGLASPDLAKGLQPGTAIRFEFEQVGPGEFVVSRIEALDPRPAGTR